MSSTSSGLSSTHSSLIGVGLAAVHQGIMEALMAVYPLSCVGTRGAAVGDFLTAV